MPTIPTPHCGWRSLRALEVLQRWLQMLRELVVFVSYFLARTTLEQQTVLAATIWLELHRGISRALNDDNVRMRAFAEASGNPHYNAPQSNRPRSPVPLGTDPPECIICMDRTPTVALDPCGHTFCHQCIRGQGRCLICRQFIMSRLNIYL